MSPVRDVKKLAVVYAGDGGVDSCHGVDVLRVKGGRGLTLPLLVS